MKKCEVCGKERYDEKNKETDVRLCCDHPDAQRTCTPCYIGGKGNHSQHSGERSGRALHKV